MIPEFAALLAAVRRGERPKRLRDYWGFEQSRTAAEFSAVIDWTAARFPEGESTFALAHPRGDVPGGAERSDPPDVELIHRKGPRFGVEVIELVDREVARAFAQFDQVSLPKVATDELQPSPKEYTYEEFCEAIRLAVIKAAAQQFKDSPWDFRVLLLCSDEPFIDHYFTRIPAVDQSYFHEMWLILPPKGNTGLPDAKEPACRLYEIPGWLRGTA